jgi:hypothetical protein
VFVCFCEKYQVSDRKSLARFIQGLVPIGIGSKQKLMSVSRSEWNTALRKMQSFEIAFAEVCGMFFALG